MFGREFFLPLAIIVLSGAAFGQSTTTASPSPTPAAKRPTLDQFGLSTGVFSNTASTAPASRAEPTAKAEYVDQNTFDTVSQLIEKSGFMEAELSRALNDAVDISPTSQFSKYFEHHITGIMHVSEVQRTGRFGGEGIKSGELATMLQQIERAGLEIVAVLGAGHSEYNNFSKELNAIAAKYKVPLLTTPSAGTPLDKPLLLKAMMARMNGNFARVKRQMAVR